MIIVAPSCSGLGLSVAYVKIVIITKSTQIGSDEDSPGWVWVRLTDYYVCAALPRLQSAPLLHGLGPGANLHISGRRLQDQATLGCRSHAPVPDSHISVIPDDGC